MKRFTYRLEPVLRQRQWALRDAEIALADANAGVARQEARVAPLLERHAEAIGGWHALVGAGRECGIDALARQAAYAADASTRLALERTTLAGLEEARDAVAARLATCSLEVDAVDDHRARTLAAFRRAATAKVFAAADDHWTTTRTERLDDEY